MAERLDAGGVAERPDHLEQTLTATARRGAETLARTLHARSGSVDDLVAAICDQAVDIVGPATAAGVIVVSARHRLTTVAATGPAPAELDRLQTETGEGPCLTAASDQVVVQVRDTVEEDRWPAYAKTAQRLGVRSVLCLPLAADDRLLGTLSLYAEAPEAFGDVDGSAVALLTALASIALAQTRLIEQLRDALTNRDRIGQAKGVLMARYELGPDEAFALLRQYSQDRNVKLADLADRVAAHRGFPT